MIVYWVDKPSTPYPRSAKPGTDPRMSQSVRDHHCPIRPTRHGSRLASHGTRRGNAQAHPSAFLFPSAFPCSLLSQLSQLAFPRFPSLHSTVRTTKQPTATTARCHPNQPRYSTPSRRTWTPSRLPCSLPRASRRRNDERGRVARQLQNSGAKISTSISSSPAKKPSLPNYCSWVRLLFLPLSVITC